MGEQLRPLDEERQSVASFEGERGRQLCRALAGYFISDFEKLTQEDVVNLEDLGPAIELTAPGLTVLVPREVAVYLTDMPQRV